ncbi:MAG: ABC transporter permease [Candidatus Methanomethyliaceae archaeon]
MRLRYLKRNRLAIVGAVGVGIFIVIAILADFLQPYPEDSKGAIHIDTRLLPPSKVHYFGTTELGRDVFSLVIAGARLSLIIGILTISCATSLGMMLGVAAAMIGGVVGELIMRITDLFLCFPMLLLAMAIAALLGPGLTNAMIAVALSWWPSYVRLTYGEVITIKALPFVESAKSIGVSTFRLIFRHILPNILSVVLVNASLDLGLVILTTSSLSFLGLGAQPPMPEWGLLISTGRVQFLTQWWIVTFPGLALFSVALSFSLLGDGLREAMDPRARVRGLT